MALDEAIARALSGPSLALPPDDPARPRPRSRRRSAARTAGFRPDVQGLRALAVVVVVLNHLTGWPRGGFLGVDVFFVISGYLITGLLLREHGRTNRISLIDFYKRRVRRLMPAALTVTALTIVTARYLFSTARFHTTAADGGWATIFWANWHFISTGTDYFTARGPTSPFQHYWSLSVEEQFYLVWPTLLFVGLLLQSRLTPRLRGRRPVIALGLALAAGSVAFWYSYHQSADDAVRAYFSSVGRAWELGLGAILALLGSVGKALWRTRALLSIAGLGATVVSFFVVRPQDQLPAPAALLACLGAAAVIAAGQNAAPVRNPLLTNRVAVYIGDVSYSIYLVHFPIIVFLDSLIAPRSGYYYAAAVLLTIGTSIALYSFIERPVLDSRWLRPRQRGPLETALADRPARLVPAMAACTALIVGLGVFALRPGTGSADAAVAAALQQGAAAPAVGAPAAPPKQRQLTAAIAKALQAESWPKLKPSLDSVIGGPKAPADLAPCGTVGAAPAAECTFGAADAAHLAVVVGDSISMAYAEAYKDIVKSLPGWRLRVLGTYGCSFVDRIIYNPDKSWETNCVKRNAQVVRIIRQLHPDLLLVTNAAGDSKDADGHLLSSIQWSQTRIAELDKVKDKVGKIAIVAAPPWDKDVADCYTPTSTPTHCVSVVNPQWTSRTQAEKLLAPGEGAVFIDSKPWFCDSRGLCPAFVGRTPTKQDLEHPSAAYMDKIWPVMLEAFQAARLFR